MGLVHLVRHAEPAAAWGEAADPGLSALGREQARKAAAALHAGIGRQVRLVSTPLARCRETAEPLAALLGTSLAFADAVAEVRAPDGAERRAWLATALAGTWAEAGLEPWRAGMAAFLCALPGEAVVFSHFVAIIAAVSTALGDARTLTFRPAHASVTTLEICDDGLRLIRLGAEMESQVL
jgi:broad specificity phosphatase PhoE